MTRILALNSYHCFYSDFTSLQKIGHCSWSWSKKGYLNVWQLLCLVLCKDKTRTVMSVFFNYVVLCVVMMSWCWLGDLEENLSCPLTSSFSASTYDTSDSARRTYLWHQYPHSRRDFKLKLRSATFFDGTAGDRWCPLTEDTLNIVEKVRFANFKLDFASFHSHCPY